MQWLQEPNILMLCVALLCAITKRAEHLRDSCMRNTACEHDEKNKYELLDTAWRILVNAYEKNKYELLDTAWRVLVNATITLAQNPQSRKHVKNMQNIGSRNSVRTSHVKVLSETNLRKGQLTNAS